MRATSNQQRATTSRDTAANPARRTARKRNDDSASDPPAAKHPCHQGLTKRDVRKIVKLVLDAINDDDSERDLDEEVEIATTEEVKYESDAQELRKNIGM